MHHWKVITLCDSGVAKFMILNIKLEHFSPLYVFTRAIIADLESLNSKCSSSIVIGLSSCHLSLNFVGIVLSSSIFCISVKYIGFVLRYHYSLCCEII